jgi:hypothetical protein
MNFYRQFGFRGQCQSCVFSGSDLFNNAAVAEELVVEFAPGGGFGLAMIPVCGRLRVVRK